MKEEARKKRRKKTVCFRTPFGIAHADLIKRYSCLIVYRICRSEGWVDENYLWRRVSNVQKMNVFLTMRKRLLSCRFVWKTARETTPHAPRCPSIYTWWRTFTTGQTHRHENARTTSCYLKRPPVKKKVAHTSLDSLVGQGSTHRYCRHNI